MRVRAREGLRFYFNYQVLNAAEGDVLSGGVAEFLAAAGAPVEVLDGPPEPERDTGPDQLDIEASAAEVLAWVGEDAARAGEALAAEQAKDKPRAVLLRQLGKLAGR